ncbi:MAG TPA: hypothetical protein VGE07_19890, partial [Herpetosiphonaceae bacterium]
PPMSAFWQDLTASELRVLRLLAAIPHPVGYFGLAIRLSHQRRLLRQHLAAALDSLVAKGLACHEPAPGQPFGAYAPSEAGLAYLADFPPTEPPPAAEFD